MKMTCLHPRRSSSTLSLKRDLFSTHAGSGREPSVPGRPRVNACMRDGRCVRARRSHVVRGRRPSRRVRRGRGSRPSRRVACLIRDNTNIKYAYNTTVTSHLSVRRRDRDHAEHTRHRSGSRAPGPRARRDSDCLCVA